jgi:TPR repeat/Tetratricopeptide repeat
MRRLGKLIAVALLAVAGTTESLAVHIHFGKKEAAKEKSASVTVVAGNFGCKVDIDGAGSGVTGTDGKLLILGVEPGDHYIHIDCPGREEISDFLFAQAGQKALLKPAAPAKLSPLEAAEARTHLRHIVVQADQLRANGEFDEAVKLLREATKLDRSNADLHRELGITFLLNHEWDRAKVEMLEAVRHDPNNVDAHSGLGYAFDKLGDLDDALKQYRICTHLDPDDSSYQEHYVDVLAEMAARQAANKH